MLFIMVYVKAPAPSPAFTIQSCHTNETANNAIQPVPPVPPPPLTAPAAIPLPTLFRKTASPPVPPDISSQP
jgi:hypothetical protein